MHPASDTADETLIQDLNEVLALMRGQASPPARPAVMASVSPTGNRSGLHRNVPQAIEDLDLPESLVTDLVIRRLSIAGKSSLHSLSRTLKLSFPVIDGIFRYLRQQGFCEVKGMEGDDYVIMITSAGRVFAAERFQMCQYAGPAPVSLRDYQQSVREQAATPDIDREVLRKAFSDLVLTDELLDQLGPRRHFAKFHVSLRISGYREDQPCRAAG